MAISRVVRGQQTYLLGNELGVEGSAILLVQRVRPDPSSEQVGGVVDRHNEHGNDRRQQRPTVAQHRLTT